MKLSEELLKSRADFMIRGGIVFGNGRAARLWFTSSCRAVSFDFGRCAESCRDSLIEEEEGDSWMSACILTGREIIKVKSS